MSDEFVSGPDLGRMDRPSVDLDLLTGQRNADSGVFPCSLDEQAFDLSAGDKVGGTGGERSSHEFGDVGIDEFEFFFHPVREDGHRLGLRRDLGCVALDPQVFEGEVTGF